ncbi:MAG: hypothetical protein DPW18_11980 [Chloroflexi bacterium]|nr:hypothetical protein [Chloroflexota bacterium]MDL1942531.1 hypothetical protein [Chloroflexi bacterium CFX2]
MKDKIKPFEEIARIFQISNESAKYFLNRVQKSFKVERPPHKLILEFLEKQNYQFQPTPYDVALAMKESGVWNYDLASPPPAVEDEEDIYR